MNTPTLESWFARMGAGETVVHQTEALIRQGEWFFVPAPQLVADAKRIRHHEPIRRSGGKTHTVEEVFRTGGEAIYYSEARRRVLTVPQFRKLLQQRPQAVKEDWRIMQRGMSVYGRGMVRHPDHDTVTLHGWHRILMNTESSAPAANHVAIMD
jgi:hypothetical protein